MTPKDKLYKVFKNILENYILDKCLSYSNGNIQRHIDKDTLNNLIDELIKEVDNIIKYGHTSLPFN